MSVMERLLAFVLRNCFITDRSLLDLQTPSPKPMTTQGNRDNIRATSIYGSNVTIPITANGISITLSHSLCNVERNGRKTLTTVQGLPKKFDQKKILKVIKKKFGMLAFGESVCREIKSQTDIIIIIP